MCTVNNSTVYQVETTSMYTVNNSTVYQVETTSMRTVNRSAWMHDIVSRLINFNEAAAL
jgi:hypothetical protein